MTVCNNRQSVVLIEIWLVCQLFWSMEAVSQDIEKGETRPLPDPAFGPFNVYKEVKETTRVHRGMNGMTIMVAKIDSGAVLKLRSRGRTGDCPAGWFERERGGFICGQHLAQTTATAARPAPEDDPHIRAGFETVVVQKKKVPVYKRLKQVGRLAGIELLRGSVLTIRGSISKSGRRYYQTRGGWYVAENEVEKRSQSVTRSGVELVGRTERPGAIVIGREAPIQSAASEGSAVLGSLPRWTVVASPDGRPLKMEGGFVVLPGGGYVSDCQVARVRVAPMPSGLMPFERWIAVDLEEQLLQAFEGERLVRIIPCSTGERGNTERGEFRIQKKLRRQTMHLRSCRVRVEDVQWVMYYDKKEGFAIHTAYWHDNFGTPVSHGCVNLPEEDARWLFDWSGPTADPEDSVRWPYRADPGARVIVF